MTSPTNPSEPNAAQVPMTEEFDSFKHTMPNALPIVIAMLLVVVVIGILAYVLRARPVVTGSIDEAYAATLPNQNSSLVILTLSFQNVTEKPLRLLNVNVAVHAKGSDFNDDFGSVTDFPRYFLALPALEQHARSGVGTRRQACTNGETHWLCDCVVPAHPGGVRRTGLPDGDAEICGSCAGKDLQWKKTVTRRARHVYDWPRFAPTR